MDDNSQRDGPHHHHHQQQPPLLYDHCQPPPPSSPTEIERTSQLYVQQEEGEGGHQLRELFNQIEPHNLGPITANQQPIKRKSRLGSSSSLTTPCTGHVRPKSSMNDTQQISTRSALRRAGVGEIVEVQGGHIVRATGRKDRHSKVCTAKGPRDRRVRLSAHTAIQFYDVQDRLGYDRPSKAVDWLIKKAKGAIDELEQLPPWSPSTMNMSSTSNRRGRGSGRGVVEAEDDESGPAFGGSNKLTQAQAQAQAQAQCEEQQQQNMYNSCHSSTFSLLPPSLDSDSIADTIKSFFPMGGPAHEVEPGAANTSSTSHSHHLQFQEYPQGGLVPRSGNSSSVRQSQDLRLSLQSFQDPMLMHSHHHQAAHDGQQSLFPGATSIGFDNPNVGWVHPNPEFSRLHRLMVGWNDDSGTDNQSANGVSSSGGGNSGRVGFVFNSQPLLQPLFSGYHSQFFTQREPLQSSNTPSIRAWNNDPSIANTSEHHQTISIHPHALSGIGFGSGGFSGFHIPARIQGEEEHDGDPNKPSSASSGSCH